MTMQVEVQGLDVELLKLDFPIFERRFGDYPLTYLDSAATSQKPRSVLDAMETFYRRHNANVHRGVYRLAEEATAAYERARNRVATFIGAEMEETVFVRNATEAINLVAYSWGRQNIGAGDVIVLTPLEHHSNLVPWQILSKEKDARLEFIELEEDGSLDLKSLDRHLSTGRVKLVACAYVSNVLGTIAPIREIAERAHLAGAKVLGDAAQAAPHFSIDVKHLDVDFLAFTAHKMLGPMGVGVLYGRRWLLEEMPPFMGGGEMIRRVELRGSTWNDLPWKFEAGTPNAAGAVGLEAAIDYLQAIGLQSIRDHDCALTAHAIERLGEIKGVHIYGPEERGALVAFTVDGIHPHDLASYLDEYGVAVRAGHHCTQPLHDRLGAEATTRASFYLYNQEQDVEKLIQAIHAAKNFFLA